MGPKIISNKNFISILYREGLRYIKIYYIIIKKAYLKYMYTIMLNNRKKYIFISPPPPPSPTGTFQSERGCCATPNFKSYIGPRYSLHFSNFMQKWYIYPEEQQVNYNLENIFQLFKINSCTCRSPNKCHSLTYVGPEHQWSPMCLQMSWHLRAPAHQQVQC